MNKSIVFHYLSKIMLISSVLFLFPAFVSLYYGETDSALTFVAVAVGVAVISLPMAIITPKNKHMFAREGLVIVALLWVIYPIIAALPFYISGEIPNFFDAVFESVSGFTTTGSSILPDIESLSKGMLFWRSFIIWVGGMGVLVLAIAILPSTNGSMYLMKAECPGPQVGKIVPKGKNSAAYLYIIYAALTIITIIFLILGDMPVFDSVCHGMSVAGTGGFGIKNDGIAYYDSAYIDGILTVAMILFGVNFSLYYFILVRRFSEVKRNTEIKIYLLIIAVATIVIMFNILPQYDSIEESFRYAVFQVSSIITSTGFSTTDFNNWPIFSQTILIILMYIGACAGSTGGGFKVQRVVIMFKSSKKYLKRLIHPNSVITVKSDGNPIDTDVVHGIHNYLVIYITLVFISLILVSINNADFTTSFSAVSTCINNIGPGLNKVGPTSNFGFFSSFSKMVLAADMLLGRLECLPLVILFSPSVWKKKF